MLRCIFRKSQISSRNSFWLNIQQLESSRHFLQLSCSSRRPVPEGKGRELIVFGISVSLFHCSVSAKKFTIYSQSNISGPFLCQRLRINVFSNFRVWLESQFIKEDLRIRELTDVAQWNLRVVPSLSRR